jgi:hypothetical protein
MEYISFWSVGTSHSAKQTTSTAWQKQAILIYYTVQPGCLCTNTSATQSALTVEAPMTIGQHVSYWQ